MLVLTCLNLKKTTGKTGSNGTEYLEIIVPLNDPINIGEHSIIKYSVIDKAITAIIDTKLYNTLQNCLNN